MKITTVSIVHDDSCASQEIVEWLQANVQLAQVHIGTTCDAEQVMVNDHMEWVPKEGV